MQFEQGCNVLNLGINADIDLRIPVPPTAQMIKNLPAMRIQSLGWEDPLEKGMVTHSSILAWRISQTEEPGGLQFIGLQSPT